MRRVGLLIAMLLISVALVPGAADASVAVEIAPVGLIVVDGAEVAAVVSVTCDPVGGVARPLEAVLTLSQNGQRILGEGEMTSILCNGLPSVQVVLVHALERNLKRGFARASAFVLVCNFGVTVCQDGHDSGDILLT